MSSERPANEEKAGSCPAPDAQPPMSDEPPIPEAGDLPGTPRPAGERNNQPKP